MILSFTNVKVSQKYQQKPQHKQVIWYLGSLSWLKAPRCVMTYFWRVWRPIMLNNASLKIVSVLNCTRIWGKLIRFTSFRLILKCRSSWWREHYWYRGSNRLKVHCKVFRWLCFQKCKKKMIQWKIIKVN
jgi:hypothetical protein